MFVCAEDQPSWSGYLAGILAERWNTSKKGRGNKRRERSDREAIEIKMTKMVRSREAEGRRRGLVAERGRKALFLFLRSHSFALFPVFLAH